MIFKTFAGLYKHRAVPLNQAKLYGELSVFANGDEMYDKKLFIIDYSRVNEST